MKVNMQEVKAEVARRLSERKRNTSERSTEGSERPIDNYLVETLSDSLKGSHDDNLPTCARPLLASGRLVFPPLTERIDSIELKATVASQLIPSFLQPPPCMTRAMSGQPSKVRVWIKKVLKAIQC